MSASPGLRELRDEYVYMKLFKDVLQSDVDMLLPGAVIKFTWIDYVRGHPRGCLLRMGGFDTRTMQAGSTGQGGLKNRPHRDSVCVGGVGWGGING